MDNKDETINIDNVKLKMDNTPIKIDGEVEIIPDDSTPIDIDGVETLDFDEPSSSDWNQKLSPQNEEQEKEQLDNQDSAQNEEDQKIDEPTEEMADNQDNTPLESNSDEDNVPSEGTNSGKEEGENDSLKETSNNNPDNKPDESGNNKKENEGVPDSAENSADNEGKDKKENKDKEDQNDKEDRDNKENNKENNNKNNQDNKEDNNKNNQDNKEHKDNNSEDKSNKNDQNNSENRDNIDNKEDKNSKKNQDNKDNQEKNSNNNARDNQNNNTKNNNNKSNNNNKGNNSNQNNRNASQNKRANNKKNSNNKNRRNKKNNNNTPKKFGNGLKNRLGGAKNNAKSAVDKAVSTMSKLLKFIIKHPVIAGIIAGIILIIIIIISVINVYGAIITPGQGNDVNKSMDDFSEKDQIILKDLNELDGINKPNAELAIYTVLFPYFEMLQNDAVSPYLNQDIELNDDEQSYFKKWINEKKDEILESYGCTESCKEFISDSGVESIIKIYAKEYVKDKIKSYLPWENDDEEDGMSDTNTDSVEGVLDKLGDPYLKLLKKKKYKKKLKKLLERLSNNTTPGDYDSETDYFDYLESDYFKDDAGYDSLFEQTTNESDLYDSIVAQLKSGAPDYKVYILQRCTTNSATTTALSASGNVAGIDGTIYVTLRDYFATNKKFIVSDYYASPALYGTDTSPLPFSRYIMGVVYAESASCIDNEACAKALMITAKSFAVGRQSSMGYSPEYVSDENKTIIHMRGNVGDQDFCDVYEGCESGTYSKDTWSVFTGEGYNNRKGPLSSEKLNNLEMWWNDIADYYVIDHDSSKFVGNQYNDYNDSCKKGSCVSQTKMLEASKNETDFNNLLFNSNNGGFDNTKYALYTSTTGELYAVTTGNQVCTDTSNNIRQTIVNFAVSMVGKIPYYFYEGNEDGVGALGHAISKEYSKNNFGATASVTDHSGRDKYGLDCSGFVDFVFWNAINNNLGNGNTDTLKSVSTEITYDEIKPGDLGFLSNDSSGTNQHVGIYIGNDEWVELNPNGVTKGAYPDFKVFYRPNILKDLDSKISTGASTGQFQSPVDNVMPSCDDYPNYSSGRYHGGTDIKVSEGTEVKAMDGGVVLESKDITSGDCSGGRYCNNGYFSYGRVIYIQHDNGVVTRYAHLSERLVLKGEKVSKGQVIAKSGNTGNSTGPHLHIEVISNGKNMSPCDYVK